MEKRQTIEAPFVVSVEDEYQRNMGTPQTFSHLKKNHLTVYREAVDEMNAKDNSTGKRARSAQPVVGQPTLQESISRSQLYDIQEGKEVKRAY